MMAPSRLYRTGFVALVGCLLSGEAAAQSIACGEPYTVRRGDTLQRIAERAYGPEASFRHLIEVNRAAFMYGDPSMLAVGQALSIPCQQAEADHLEKTTTLALLPVRPINPPDINTVFTDLAAELDLPAIAPDTQSTAPEAVLAALQAAPGPRLAGVMPRPECAASGLSTDTARLCAMLDWSDPVAEIVLSTFTLAEVGPVTRDLALTDQRLCVAQPVPLYLLSARGLLAPAAEVARPSTTADCFTALRAGSVAAVIAPAAQADAALASLGPGAAVVEQFALAQLVTIHAVALREDTEAGAALDRLNEALRRQRGQAANGLGSLRD